MRLTILHFNDLHGRLDQLPRLFTLIQRERAEARLDGRTVLLLDAGDSSDRAQWDCDITKGRANYALLEAMGVDATVIGNGEALQWGRQALARLVASVGFPVLAANLVDCAEPERLAVPKLRASVLLDCGGFPLGVIGVTQDQRSAYSRYGYCSPDPRPALRREIAALRAQGARALLLLSHLGVAVRPADRQQWDYPNDYTDEQVAVDFPELAVVVGGHSHTRLEQPLVFGQTVIVQAGDYGQYLGRLDVELDDATGALLGHAGWLIPCGDDLPPDPTIAGTLEFVREEAERLLDVRLGSVASALPHGDEPHSPFAAWVADALRDVCQADLAIFFSGFVQHGLPAGPLTRRDLYRALPGAAHVTAAVVTGAQIRRMVARMLASKYRTESFNPRRGLPPLGLPAVSGNVRLAYDLAANVVTEAFIDGQPLDDARTYRLASTFSTLNDVTTEPEYDFIGLQPGQVVEMVQVEKVLWEVVEGWVVGKRHV